MLQLNASFTAGPLKLSFRELTGRQAYEFAATVNVPTGLNQGKSRKAPRCEWQKSESSPNPS